MTGIVLILLILNGQEGWGKTKRESSVKEKKNQDGLTTSVHSHCSMSSMTEDGRPTP